MRKFVIYVFVFSVIFFILNQLPNLFLSPYYGNRCFLKKYEYFASHLDQFNTVILGSSRLYRQVNPELLDGLLKDYQTSTFNLGAPSTYNPEVYYLYEKLLKTIEPNRLKYAFIELQHFSEIGAENLKTTKNYYWHNIRYLIFSIKYILFSSFSFEKKKVVIREYITSYIYKVIYGYKEALVTEKPKKKDKFYLGKKKDGFYPLDEQMIDFPRGKHLRKRFKSFQSDKTILKERASIAKKAFLNKKNKPYLNEVHLEKVSGLIKKSKQKGVHLVFVIPPRLERYQILSIKKALPSGHAIEVANPKKYPELYQAKFTFDKGHLNSKGANIFTGYIAGELKKCLKIE